MKFKRLSAHFFTASLNFRSSEVLHFIRSEVVQMARFMNKLPTSSKKTFTIKSISEVAGSCDIPHLMLASAIHQIERFQFAQSKYSKSSEFQSNSAKSSRIINLNRSKILDSKISAPKPHHWPPLAGEPSSIVDCRKNHPKTNFNADINKVCLLRFPYLVRAYFC